MLPESFCALMSLRLLLLLLLVLLMMIVFAHSISLLSLFFFRLFLNFSLSPSISPIHLCHYFLILYHGDFLLSHSHSLVPFEWLFFSSWISIFHLALWIFISFSIIVFVRVSVCKCLLPLTIVFRDSRKQESGSNWTTNSMKFSPFKWRSYKS